MKLKPKKVDIGKLPVFRPLNADPKYSTLIEFYENVLKKTGRDRTVQRESVWRNILNKQSEYMTAVACGYSLTSLFHLVEIKNSIDYLKGVARSTLDYQYISHLEEFLKNGCETLHVDGGNRSDTIIDWYEDKIYLMAGSYTTSDGQLVTLAIENYYSRKQLIEDGGCYAELAYSIDEQPISYFEYSQLNEEDRKRLFVNLNANENLTIEEFRNCETAPICGSIRDVNDKYKDEFVEYGFVTKANAERYKFCAWLASLLNFYTFNNDCDSWTPANLDKDYKGTTGAQDKFDSWIQFFEEIFYPLISIIANYGKQKKNRQFVNLGPHRNQLIDLYISLVRIYKKDFQLARDNRRKLKLKEFFETYKEWVKPHLADGKAQYNANGKSLSTFADLYGANTAPKLEHRLKLLDNEFIPLLKEKGLIFQKDNVRSAPDKWRIPLWRRQNTICPLTGRQITQDDAQNGDITHIDHIIPHSKGGKTEMSNVQLVFAEANLIKSDK